MIARLENKTDYNIIMTELRDVLKITVELLFSDLPLSK